MRPFSFGESGQSVSVNVTAASALTCVRNVEAGSLVQASPGKCGAGKGASSGATVSVCASSSARCAESAQVVEGSSILIEVHCNQSLQSFHKPFGVNSAGNVE